MNVKAFFQRLIKKLLAEVTWKLIVTGTLALITGAVGYAIATFKPMVREVMRDRPAQIQIIRLDSMEVKVKDLTVQVAAVKKQGVTTAAIQEEFFAAMTEADPRLRQTITRRAFLRDSATDTQEKNRALLKALLPRATAFNPPHVDVN